MKLLLFLLMLLPFCALSQTPEKEVREVIDQLFDGMEKGDSSLVRRLFLPNATLNTCFVNAKGEAKVHRDSLAAFLNSIGTPHKQVWDERLLSCEIKIDGNLAAVCTNYEFYVDNVYSHEGVNAFQLVKTDDTWKILVISDTRRKKQK